MNDHCFTGEQYRNLIENARAHGVAEGRHRAKEEMGEVLDRVIESMHEGTPYRVPAWFNDRLKTYGAQEPIEALRPTLIEFSRDQMMAFRFILCGPSK